jgi:small nuclear ribonucleoprotein (snRNP)-like protein
LLLEGRVVIHYFDFVDCEKMSGLIGSKVSIITQNDLRFEGSLYTIDQQSKTVVLQNGLLFS